MHVEGELWQCWTRTEQLAQLLRSCDERSRRSSECVENAGYGCVGRRLWL
jgi:hypothetical protein